MTKKEIFFQSIKEGNFEEVRTLLLENPLLANKVNQENVSPVLIALYHNEPEIAEFLAGIRSSLNQFEAAALGRSKYLEMYLQQHINRINEFSGDGFQALGLAAFFGQEECARLLIMSGAEINTASRNPMQVTPLHSAAASQNIEIVRQLLDHGADPNVRQQGGFTPLHAAAQNGQIEMAELLLAHGAEINTANDTGQTSLMIALKANKSEMVAFLKRMEQR